MECALGDLTVSGNATVTVVVTPDVAAKNTTITNTATVEAKQSDPDTGNNTVTQDSAVTVSADLSVTKTDTVDSVAAGVGLTYTLTVTNNGPSQATAVVLTDTLPTNVTFTTALASQGSCSEASGVVTCNLGSIHNGKSATATIVVVPNTAAGTAGSVTNTATVTSAVADPAAGNNTAILPTTVTKLADIKVVKKGPINGVINGKSITYEATVTNAGPSGATNVVLTDTLPGDVTFTSVNATQGSCSESSGVVTCNLGAMNANGTATVTIVGTASTALGAGTSKNITNTVTAVAAENDPDTSSNAALAITTIYTDIDTDGVGDGIEAGAPNGGDGDNDGTADSNQDNVASLHNVVDQQYATLKSPTNTELVDVTAKDNPSPNDAPANVEFPAGFFEFSVDKLTTTTTTVEIIFPAGTIIQGYWKYGPTPGNVADHWYEFMFDAAETDPNNIGTGAVVNGNVVTLHFVDGKRGDDDLAVNAVIVDQGAPVFAPADLAVTQTESSDPIAAGDPLTYTVTVTNNGASSANNVVMTDTLPANVTFGSATPTQGACSQASGTVTCNLNTITNGAHATVVIVVTPTAAAGGTTITNTATATATEPDTVAGNDNSVEGTVVNAQADLSVTKTDAQDPVNVQNAVIYTVTVTNNGPSKATGVVLTDALPSGVTFTSAVPNQGSCIHASGTVTCNLVDLDNGSAATVTVSGVSAIAAGGTTIIATASVTSGVTDQNVGNDNVSQSTFINAVSDLVLTNTDSVDPATVNSPVTYNVTVTNSGPSPATSVVLTDNLPANVTFLTSTPSQGTCTQAGGTVTCNLGTISSGANATVTVTGTPTQAASGTNVTNTATVTSAVTDLAAGNNTNIAQATAVGLSTAAPAIPDPAVPEAPPQLVVVPESQIDKIDPGVGVTRIVNPNEQEIIELPEEGISLLIPSGARLETFQIRVTAFAPERCDPAPTHGIALRCVTIEGFDTDGNPVDVFRFNIPISREMELVKGEVDVLGGLGALVTEHQAGRLALQRFVHEGDGGFWVELPTAFRILPTSFVGTLPDLSHYALVWTPLPSVLDLTPLPTPVPTPERVPPTPTPAPVVTPEPVLPTPTPEPVEPSVPAAPEPAIPAPTQIVIVPDEPAPQLADSSGLSGIARTLAFIGIGLGILVTLAATALSAFSMGRSGRDSDE